jgi:hypothetical protein
MKEPQKRLRLFGYENRFKRFLVFKKKERDRSTLPDAALPAEGCEWGGRLT